MCKYLPDKVNKSTITREFLLSLLFNVRKDKYLHLYTMYKNQKANQNYFGGKIYEVGVTNEFANNINEYRTTTNQEILIHIILIAIMEE